MIEFLRLILHIIASFFKPRTKLVAEILVLRQQLNVLRRQVSKRPQLSNTDRLLFVWLYRWFPSVLSAIAILRPETIIRWHRAGFQSYWRERSRKPVGSYLGRRTCAGSWVGMPRIIMNRAFIARWTKMPHSIGRLSTSASSHHSLRSAAFITNIAESDFRHAHPASTFDRGLILLRPPCLGEWQEMLSLAHPWAEHPLVA